MYGSRTPVMPYAVSVCAKLQILVSLLVVLEQNTVRVHNIQRLSVNQWEGNAGKMENTNMQIRVMSRATTNS